MAAETVGCNIKKYRKLLQWNQDELAEKAGLSCKYIGQIERGEKLPSLEAFISIANALNVSSDMLLSDAITNGYRTKVNRISEKIEVLPPGKQNMVCDMLEIFLREEEYT